VDDASTDNSLTLAEHLLNDPRIMVVRNEVNVGQSKAQNIALGLVATPYMVQLDSDDWFVPHALDTLVNEFNKQPQDVAVVSGNIMVVVEESEYLQQHNNISTSYIRKGRAFTDCYDFLLSNLSLWPRCYRTNALREVGGWPVNDPFEGRNMEDRLVLLRLIEKFRFHWIDEVLYYHRRHDYNNTKKLDEYNFIIEYTTREMLQRWGDVFEPMFMINEYGWKVIIGIKEKIKKKKILDKALYHII
jgi:cellulose synthase/poly-beta-1,6-N-acetylglucosamine synthase-like glycosyltransferase